METIDGAPATSHGASSSDDESEDVTFAPQWARKVRFSYTVLQLQELRSVPLSLRMPNIPSDLYRDLVKEEQGLLPDLDEPARHSPQPRPTKKGASASAVPSAAGRSPKPQQPRNDDEEDMERRFRERFGAFKSMFSEEETGSAPQTVAKALTVAPVAAAAAVAHVKDAEGPSPSRASGGSSRLLGLLHKKEEPVAADDMDLPPTEDLAISPPALPASVAALFASVATPSPAQQPPKPAAAADNALPPSVAALFASPLAAAPARSPPPSVQSAAARPAGPRQVSLQELFASASATQPAPPSTTGTHNDMMRLFGAGFGNFAAVAPPVKFTTLDDLENENN